MWVGEDDSCNDPEQTELEKNFLGAENQIRQETQKNKLRNPKQPRETPTGFEAQEHRPMRQKE